jgi:hypothetical protein
MARLPLRHEGNPDTDRAILAALDRVAASGFPMLNVFRFFANKPESIDGFMSFRHVDLQHQHRRRALVDHGERDGTRVYDRDVSNCTY